jgi:murein DD-endopeptidase MepM/ murein hydrolase activator NlpD
VQVGDTVTAGQLIGLTGGARDDPYSGNSTGAHLHAEYRLNSGAPQVPGGYNYNAINIYPLLVSKKGEEKVLYKLEVIINNLAVRRGPANTFQGIRNTGKGIFLVYEEKHTQGQAYPYGRISQTESEWVNLDPRYSNKIEAVDNPEVPIEISDAEKLKKLWDAHPELH